MILPFVLLAASLADVTAPEQPIAPPANYVVGYGKHRPRRLGIFPHDQPFLLIAMEDGDSIGSVLWCMDEVHKRGGGVCVVAPHSIRPSRHKALRRKHPDVSLQVSPESN
jgi:hypothetical protein